MKARLKFLPNEPRGSAWPSSARTVRRAVKSVNERDPCFFCHFLHKEGGTIEGPLAMSQRKARSTIGLYAPNLLGYTWTTMAWTIGCNAERRSQSPKPCLSSDRGLKFTLVKVKSLVIAGHYPAVNMSLLLAHTARQTNRV